MAIEAPAPQIHGRTLYLADSDALEIRAWLDGFASSFGRHIPTVPLFVARAAALLGDFIVGCGGRFPVTSKRLDNLLTEYRYDVAPIEQIHGRTQISNEEGVRRTAEWLRAQDRARSGEMT